VSVFQFVTPPSANHEFVKSAQQPGQQSLRQDLPATRSYHILRPRHAPDKSQPIQDDGWLANCGGVCRVFGSACPKIPFFCPATDTANGSFSLLGLAKWGDWQMISNASGRSALILTAALFALLATPVTAATDGDDSASGARSGGQAAAPVRLHRTFRHALHHRRHYVHRRIHTIAKAAADDDNDKKAPDVVSVVDSKSVDTKNMPARIPPQVANANAQMLLAGAQISAAVAIPPGTAVPAAASDTANADRQTVIAAADQLNDADRTLQEGSTAATSAASPPPAPAPAPAATASMTGDSSVWDQTSLIGKIFIGFGALLTMASAARMFIT
jgi:hypothetical protein